MDSALVRCCFLFILLLSLAYTPDFYYLSLLVSPITKTWLLFSSHSLIQFIFAMVPLPKQVFLHNLDVMDLYVFFLFLTFTLCHFIFLSIIVL